MADSQEALLLLIDQTTGENPTTWGTKEDTNNALIAQAVKHAYPCTVGAATGDLTLSDDAYIANENRRGLIRMVGTRSAAGNLVFPTRALIWFVGNETDYTLTCKTSAGTGIALPPDETRLLFCDGTDILDSGLINQTQLTNQLSASSAAGFSTTSTTSNAISVAGTNLTFTTADSGKAFSPGSPLRIARTSDPAAQYMDAICTSYSSTTLMVTTTAATGAGTFSDWTISVAGGPDVTLATMLRATKTGAYVVTTDDNGYLIDCTSGTFTVTLPAAATTGAGFNIRVINSGTGVVTVDGDGSETIDGRTTESLQQYQYLHLFCTGTAWLILGDSRRRILQAEKTGAYTLVLADIGTVVPVNGTYTVDATAAATLGAGWRVTLRNSGTGIVTFDPASTEVIKDAWSVTQTAIYLHRGQEIELVCDGTGWLVAHDTRFAVETWAVALSDETTAITTGTAKVTFRFGSGGFEIIETPLATLSTVSSSGNPTFDINDDGSSIFSTNKLSIDANEKTSATAATAASFTAPVRVAAGSEMTIDCDTAGTGAKGAKVFITGRRTP